MTLQEKLQDELKNTILLRDDEKKSFIKIIISELNRISRVVSDEDVIKTLQKLRKYAVENNNQYEIDYLDLYLPVFLNEEETKTIISEIIQTNNFSSMKDMGALMKLLKDYKTINPKIASQLVKELLN